MDLSSHTIVVVRNIGYRHPFAIKLVARWGTGATSITTDDGFGHETDPAAVQCDGAIKHSVVTQESTTAHAKGTTRLINVIFM